MSSVAARGGDMVTTEAYDGSEADYPRYLLDRIVEIADPDSLVFFIPNFEEDPWNNQPVTDYGPHALPFRSYEGAGNIWDRPPTIKGSVLRYHMNGVDEAVDCADDDLFSMGADGTAPNEPAFSLIIAAKFNNVINSELITRFDGTNLAEKCEFRLDSVLGGELRFRIYDNNSTNYIGRIYNTALVENIWYIIIATYNGNRSQEGIRFFINGVRVDDTNSSGGAYTAMHNRGVVTSVGYLENGGGALTNFLDGDWYGALCTARQLSDGGVAEGAMAADGSDVLKMTQCYRRLLGI